MFLNYKVHISELHHFYIVPLHNRLCWFGHLQPMDEEKRPRKILNFELNCSYPGDCPKKKWFNNIRSGLYELRLSTSLAQDRSKLRNAIKPSRHVAKSNPRCWEKEGQKAA